RRRSPGARLAAASPGACCCRHDDRRRARVPRRRRHRRPRAWARRGADADQSIPAARRAETPPARVRARQGRYEPFADASTRALAARRVHARLRRMPNALLVRDWPLPYAAKLAPRAPAAIDLVVVHCTELPDLATARVYGEHVLYASGTGN